MVLFMKIIRRFFGVLIIIPVSVVLVVFGTILFYLSFVELFFEYIITGDKEYYKQITDSIVFGIPKTIAKIFNVITGKEE